MQDKPLFCTMRRLTLPLCLIAALLAGCDMLGIESAAQVSEKKEAEGKAIGSACRHAVRSVEDCFRSNPKAGKAAVFAGWKEMDAYMRENEIVGMPSAVVETPVDAAATQETAPGEEADAKAHGGAVSDKPSDHGKKTHKS